MQVTLDGSGSHTHAVDADLAGFVWEDVSTRAVLAKTDKLSCFFPIGTHTISLTITDTKQRSLATTQTFVVAKQESTPGLQPHLETVFT